MEMRAFQFTLPTSARLPAHTCVFWASSLWWCQETNGRVSLFVFPKESEMAVCQVMASRLRKAGLTWVGLQGRHQVEVVSHGSYIMTEANPGLWTGIRHETCPHQWLSRMIVLNGQEAIVQALKGTYLVGPPWEELSVLLTQVREDVEELRQAKRPSWNAIAQRCERLIEAGFVGDEDVQQFLHGLWTHVPFREPWEAILKKHQTRG